jgi:uncharacterized protein YkwD
MNFRQFLRSLWKSLGRAPAPKPAPRPTPAPAPPRPAPVPPSPPAPAPGEVHAELLAAHNARHAAAGLHPLAASAKLQAAAQAHADLMARRGEMSHQLPGEADLGARLTAAGYSFLRAGENVARGQRTVAEVMTSWLSSPGHRANILSAHYTQGGFAVAYGADGSPYWAVDFGSPTIRAMVPAVQSPYTTGTPEVTEHWYGAASSVAVAAD